MHIRAHFCGDIDQQSRSDRPIFVFLVCGQSFFSLICLCMQDHKFLCVAVTMCHPG